jgi:hypothetical protein
MISQIRINIFLFLLIFSAIFSDAQVNHGRIKVTPDGHYLQYENGTPFFWLGDTGWELFHRLDLQEIKNYLDNRAAKGFNVIQAVALAEFDGLTRPNRYGELPLQNLDPTQPNEKYFSVIDSTIHMARERNIFIGLLPTWGDKVTKMWGTGPMIFDSVNAYKYGRWLGNRYKNDENIIWILGGDRPAVQDSNDWRPVWRQMAKGISDGTDKKCIIAYHPSGGKNSTSQWIHHESWLDINMFQSGHGDGHDVACWDLVQRDRGYSPIKPTLDAEPNYEDHPVNPWPKWNVDNGYFRDYDVRKQIYRSVFAGACGVTYGHHAMWQFFSEREEIVNFADRGWVNAMDRPGAYQAGYLKKLIESRPMSGRIPDNAIVVDGQGNTNSEHLEAFRSADNSYCMVYLPVGKKITMNLKFMKAKKINEWWFNPKDASSTKEILERKDNMEFNPKTMGAGNDWVLVVDDADKKFDSPGR